MAEQDFNGGRTARHEFHRRQVPVLILPEYIQVYLVQVVVGVHVYQPILSWGRVRDLGSIGVRAVDRNLEVGKRVAQVGGAAAHHTVATATIDSWWGGECRMDGQRC